MAGTPFLPPRGYRTLTGAVYILAVASGNLFGSAEFSSRLFGAALGLGVPALAKLVWNERTRPKPTAAWFLGGPLVLAAAFFVGSAIDFGTSGLEYVLPLSLIVGACLVHDLSIGPSLMLTATLVGVMLQPVSDWARLPESSAWTVGTSSLLAVTAALLERERLSVRDAPPTPWMWTGVRLGFLALWTVLCLALRKQLRLGGLFSVFGADPGTPGGRFFLYAIIIAAIIIAALAFKTRKVKPRDGEPAPNP